MPNGFPINPYPIVGILQGAVSGITITGKNLTSGGSESVVTAEDGSFILDPVNMNEEGYNNGDIIEVRAGAWYYHISIDTSTHPDGIIKDLARVIEVSKRRAGMSMLRGISVGKRKR